MGTTLRKNTHTQTDSSAAVPSYAFFRNLVSHRGRQGIEGMLPGGSPFGGAIRYVPSHRHPDEETPWLESRGRRPKLGLPDLLISYGLRMSQPAPRAGRLVSARRIVTRFYLCVTPLPCPADWVAARLWNQGFFFPRFTQVCRTCICLGGRLRESQCPGKAPRHPGPPSCNLSLA